MDGGRIYFMLVSVGWILILFSVMGFESWVGHLAFASYLLASLLACEEALGLDTYMSSSEYIPLRTRGSSALISSVAGILLTLFTFVVG